MATAAPSPNVDIPVALVDAIRSFPTERIVEHCGKSWSISPFEIYTDCPHCGAKTKVRAFSGCAEIEDVFDAVFEWMNQPGGEKLAQQRREWLDAEDAD